MATCERCGLSKWFLSLSDNGLCPACAEAELKEAAEKSHASTREIDKPAQTAIRSDSPTVDSLARVPSLQEEPIRHFDKYVGQEEIRKALLLEFEAAVLLSRPLPIFFWSAPPEREKEILAYMIAGEIKFKIFRANGSVIEKPVFFSPLLKTLKEKVFFLFKQ